jgi:acetoin utilization protein AcuB
MLVAEWMTRDVLTVGPDDKVSTAAHVLGKRRIRQVPVVEGERLVGLVTKSDLLRACPPDLNPFSLIGAVTSELARPIRDIMTTEVVTARPDSPLEEAAHQLIDGRINSLPVVSNLRLTGILTGSDISRALLAALGAGTPGVRITFEVAGHEDVFALVSALAKKHEARVRNVTTFEHDGHHVAIVRLDQERPDMVEELWQGGHRVSSVARFR